LEIRVIKTSSYAEFKNTLIPTVFEVIWRLEKADFSHAKFKISGVEYNKAEKIWREVSMKKSGNHLNF
jgi:hypothetical protein